jgi:hypothetical protein
VVEAAVAVGVDREPALQVGAGAVELADREVAVPAPAIEHRVSRGDVDPAREGRDGFPITPDGGLGQAERDEALHVARLGRER